MQQFETARLLMRPLKPEDQAFYCACYTDLILMQHIGEPLTHEAALRSFTAALKINSTLPIRRRTWVMQESLSGLSIGLLGLGVQPSGQQWQQPEIGFIVVECFQRRGFALEAVNALVDFAFSSPSVAALSARHADKNGAASGLMEKLGFKREALQHEPSASCGWRLLRADWQERPISSAQGDYN